MLLCAKACQRSFDSGQIQRWSYQYQERRRTNTLDVICLAGASIFPSCYSDFHSDDPHRFGKPILDAVRMSESPLDRQPSLLSRQEELVISICTPCAPRR